MIAFIKGIVVSYNMDSVILENHGIGYRIYMPNPSHLILNEETLIYTYQHFREDAQILFGFQSLEEHDLFVRLISVKGIGPKIAMQALSASSTQSIISAIETGDATALKRLPGIGNKAASQIVLDLKGKLVESETSEKVVNQNLQDAIEALKSLGYRNQEIHSIMKELNEDVNLSVDEYVRKALALMLKKKGV
ncbi:MAG: Holliday junction branch migration protein RuvA [Erysipelotrichia bacterium]|nr:Holliday junction branch migration protein RuvA [Erysipelotrichia bacterium]NCC55143.1 Holliday junction branch migration protein RuvA [Erysipelotrichia bacterium]